MVACWLLSRAGTAPGHAALKAPGPAPRPLLVLHGTADRILPEQCARYLYFRASEPKELELYVGDGNRLKHHQAELPGRLVAWTVGVLPTTG